MFKKDDYIVLLHGNNPEGIKFGYPGFIPNHCYKLRCDDYFSTYMDSYGCTENAWAIVVFNNPQGISPGGAAIRISWRYATSEEKEMYETLQKPFDTHRFSIINKLLVD